MARRGSCDGEREVVREKDIRDVPVWRKAFGTTGRDVDDLGGEESGGAGGELSQFKYQPINAWPSLYPHCQRRGKGL